eukprot:397091-Rhodomonas_salina.1
MLLLISANCSVIDAAAGQLATLLLLYCMVRSSRSICPTPCPSLQPSEWSIISPPSPLPSAR